MIKKSAPVENPYGLTEELSPTRKAVRRAVPKKSPPSKKKLVPQIKKVVVQEKSQDVSYIPDLEIQYGRLALPAEAVGLKLENTVSLSEELLHLVKTRTELRTKNLSNLILRNVVPSMLACDAALSYSQTFLEHGFGFDTVPDRTVQDSLTELMRFEVLTYFIRVSRLPKAVKTRLMRNLTDLFGEQMMVSLQDSLTKKKTDDRVKDMEAFVMRTRSNGKSMPSKRPGPDLDPQQGAVRRRGP